MNDEITSDSEPEPEPDQGAEPTVDPATEDDQSVEPTVVSPPTTTRTVERRVNRTIMAPDERDPVSFTWGAFTVAAILAAFTIGLFAFIVVQFAYVDDTPVYQVAWSADDVEFDESAPSNLWYDHKNEKLKYRGRISKEVRIKLRNLNFKEQATPAEIRSFHRSIDELAFKSNEQTFRLWYLMLITAAGGMLGVQARSISYFVLHAGPMNDLDLEQWWSWYFMRPLLGMIFGPLTVLLIKAEVIASPDIAGGPLLAMFIISILVGLIASLFFGKLVQTAQVLFGVDMDDSAGKVILETKEKRVKVSPSPTDHDNEPPGDDPPSDYDGSGDDERPEDQQTPEEPPLEEPTVAAPTVRNDES